MIAVYPIALTLGLNMELAAFYKVSAVVNAIVIAIIGIGFILGKNKRTTKFLASICIYVALGNMLFGLIMGET